MNSYAVLKNTPLYLFSRSIIKWKTKYFFNKMIFFSSAYVILYLILLLTETLDSSIKTYLKAFYIKIPVIYSK